MMQHSGGECNSPIECWDEAKVEVASTVFLLMKTEDHSLGPKSQRMERHRRIGFLSIGDPHILWLPRVVWCSLPPVKQRLQGLILCPSSHHCSCA
jgi:hypothetical protein